MKHIFIVIIIKCVNLINGEWVQVFSEDFNDNLDDAIWDISHKGCFQNNVIIKNGTAFMKVIKNKSNNEQLKDCENLYTHISTYTGNGWINSKFEIRANFESNCGAYASFGFNNQKKDKNLCPNGCIASYVSKMDCINDNYKSGFLLKIGQNFNKIFLLNKTEEMKTRSGYHLFSVEWNQKEIVWKIDEIIYKSESLDKHFNRSETEEILSENPFKYDFNFYIHNAVFNNDHFNISEAYVLIDFVKEYEWFTDLDNKNNVITIANNNTITSCYSCDCGLPALPPQVVIKRYKHLTSPKKYKNGQVVNFDCYWSLNHWTKNFAKIESAVRISSIQDFVDILIGSKISVCTDGKWNKKSGVCARWISEGINFKYAKINENGKEIIETAVMDLAHNNGTDGIPPSHRSFLNWNISFNQTLIIELDYVQLFDIFDLGINSKSNQFLNAVNNKLITITATIKRKKSEIEDYEDCRLIQTGILFELIKYPLFRFKCKHTVSFRYKQLHWTHTIIINFKVNENLTQISAELWQIILYRTHTDCGEPEKILNSIENNNPQNIAADMEYRVKCKPGFKLVGNEVLKCLGFGDWNFDFPKCEFSNMTCLISDIPQNSSLIIDDTQKFQFEDKFYALEDSKIRFSCNQSENIRYKLIGSEQQICKLGKWSQSMPKCIEVKPCNIPESNNFLKVNVSKLLTFNNNNITNIMADDQSYATYYCDNEEQILTGTSVRQCINGLWVPDSDIFCENKQNVSLIIIIIVILIFLILVLIIAIFVIIRNKNKRKFDDNNKEIIDDNYDDAFPDIEFHEYSEVKYTKRDEYLEILDNNYECITYEDLSQTNDCNENPTYLEIT